MKLNKEQIIASNPENSAWVAASAGTGKTKVLTDRIVRLLVNGSNPAKILCLTFTKAAASEMEVRINNVFARWAIMGREDLNNELSSILGRSPLPEEIKSASKLYERKLKASDHLRIQTIHSFCQQILKIFPIEAGINPGFKVIDEFKSDEILEEVRIDLISRASNTPNSEVASAIEFIASHLQDSSLAEVIKSTINDRSKFRDLFIRFPKVEDYEIFLRAQFGLSTHEYESNIQSEGIKRILSHLSYFDISDVKYDNDLKVLNFLNNFIELSSPQQASKFEQLMDVFLTQAGERRAKIITSTYAKAKPHIEQTLLACQDIVIETKEKLSSLGIIFFTKHLYIVAQEIIKDYDRFKSIHGYLDFEDLIYKTKQLIIDEASRDWILYKLDGGIEHLLVDEAQDTSRDQWLIIEALVSEFYSGLSQNEANRTLFVVGDFKQSIYSFQGADPEGFLEMRHYFQARMKEAEKAFELVNLGWSYRSNNIIVNGVAHTFSPIKYKYPALFSEEEIFIQSGRSQSFGKIEIFPLIKPDPKGKVKAWNFPLQASESRTSEMKLAEYIASFIAEKVHSKYILKSQNRPVNAGDFLILVRRRGSFTKRLIDSMRAKDVEVAGIDRLDLKQSLSVQDIVAMAKFVLMPYDDLNLAGLLKSPFVGMSEEGLFSIAKDRKKEPIWQYMQQAVLAGDMFLQKPVSQLQQFIDLYSNYGLSNFFKVILNSLNFRCKLLSMNIDDNGEVIDEFIGLVENFERTSNSLQEFIFWYEKNKLEVKRDLEEASAVRVMTVHGSKGLQAPIVIMADTAKAPKMFDKFLWNREGNLYWPGYAENYNEYYKELANQHKDADYQEYLRLLYVAMTRAADELVVFGASETGSPEDGSWYDIMTKNLETVLTKVNDAELSTEYFINNCKMYMEGGSIGESTIKARELENLPLPEVKITRKPVIEFKEAFTDIVASPLKEITATTYGSVVHKLLEDFIKSRSLSAIKKNPILDLLDDDPIKFKAIEQVMSLADHIIFATDAELLAEVEIGVTQEGITKIERLDLLSILEDQVTIIDYKTDAKIPTIYEEIPKSYIAQLQNYMQAVTHLYQGQGKKVKAAILWLADGSITEIKGREYADITKSRSSVIS